MKATVLSRIIAKSIDLLVVIALSVVLPRFLGPLVGFLYSLFADGIRFRAFEGQSFGKVLLGLEVRNRVRQTPANYRDSLIRNAPIGLATFFAIIPFWGWLILVLVGLPVLAIEVYLMMRNPAHERIGDAMADTEVIEKKKINGL